MCYAACTAVLIGRNVTQSLNSLRALNGSRCPQTRTFSIASRPVRSCGPKISGCPLTESRCLPSDPRANHHASGTIFHVFAPAQYNHCVVSPVPMFRAQPRAILSHLAGRSTSACSCPDCAICMREAVQSLNTAQKGIITAGWRCTIYF